MTAISYATIVISIFIARYVPVLRLTFKGLAYILGGELSEKFPNTHADPFQLPL